MHVFTELKYCKWLMCILQTLLVQVEAKMFSYLLVGRTKDMPERSISKKQTITSVIYCENGLAKSALTPA